MDYCPHWESLVRLAFREFHCCDVMMSNTVVCYGEKTQLSELIHDLLLP
jgi:hypothetical protein